MNGDGIVLSRDVDAAILQRPDQDDRDLPLVRRSLGEELAEELRRLDSDQIYADTLTGLTGVTGLEGRAPMRVHVWQDPALADVKRWHAG